MSQRLILPINQVKLTASWKTDAYQKKFGFIHYGVDMVSTAGDRKLYASGDGIVLHIGTDSVVGKVVVIQYHHAIHRLTGEINDVAFRYFHLENIHVKPGNMVTKDSCFGVYGNSGSLKMALHLHMEADTDCENSLYSPTILNSSLLKGRAHGATDSTMRNPLEWLHCKASPPDLQSYTTAGDIYIRPEDRLIGTITEC